MPQSHLRHPSRLLSLSRLFKSLATPHPSYRLQNNRLIRAQRKSISNYRPIRLLQPLTPNLRKASVSGAIYSFTTKIRVAGTYAYLTPALGENKDQMPGVLIGPQKEKGDFAFHTDDKGNFELNNVPPGKYFIILWAPMTWNEVQVSETDIKALLVDLPADQKTVLGTLYIAWP